MAKQHELCGGLGSPVPQEEHAGPCHSQRTLSFLEQVANSLHLDHCRRNRASWAKWRALRSHILGLRVSQAAVRACELTGKNAVPLRVSQQGQQDFFTSENSRCSNQTLQNIK